MLARSGKPFDSPEYIYEIKWDGTRAIALIGPDDFHLHNRKILPMRDRYPEMDLLAELEPGLVLDGEIVVMRDDRPSFTGMLKREQSRTARTAAHLARTLPATYVVFDLLYRNYEPRLTRTLEERRAELEEVIAAHQNERLVFSDGVVGTGVAFFEQASDEGLEGVMAKRLRSRYQPGRRTDSWVKFKRSETIYCAIVGYLEEGGDLRSLLIATEDEGRLRYVGRVGSGLDEAIRAHLLPLLQERHRERPIVPCRDRGIWLEPGLYCTVSYLERTELGELRAPVFKELVED